MELPNFRNVLITSKDVNNIFKKGGLKKKLNNVNYYIKSFTHFSYSKDFQYEELLNNYVTDFDFIDFKKESNERFEFAGDSIINNVVCEYLFERYETENEGFLTKLKTKIISKEYLSIFAAYLGFDKFLILSNHMENLNGRTFNSTLEDSFEAFIYAMVKDGIKREHVRQFIINIMEECVDFSKLIFNNENYKDRIKKYSQKINVTLEFKLESVLGPPTSRTYTVTCYLNNKKLKSGCAYIKKDAEHIASLHSLLYLGEISEEEHEYIKS